MHGLKVGGLGWWALEGVGAILLLQPHHWRLGRGLCRRGAAAANPLPPRERPSS